jgi:hypothetical protein
LITAANRLTFAVEVASVRGVASPLTEIVVVVKRVEVRTDEIGQSSTYDSAATCGPVG